MLEEQDLAAVADLCKLAVVQYMDLAQAAAVVAPGVEDLLEYTHKMLRNGQQQQQQQQEEQNGDKTRVATFSQDAASKEAIAAVMLAASLASLHPDNVISELTGWLLQAANAATNGNEDNQLTHLLAAIPAAVHRRVNADAIADSIMALTTDSYRLRVLCRLPAANKISPEAVMAAMKAAVHNKNADSLCCLTELAPAAAMSTADVGMMKRAALEAQGQAQDQPQHNQQQNSLQECVLTSGSKPVLAAVASGTSGAS